MPPADGELFLEAINWNQMSMAVAPPLNSSDGSTAAMFSCVINPGGGGDSGWVAYTWRDDDLYANRQYGYQVKYRNVDGIESDFNATTAKYTLAQTASSSDNATSVYITCDQAFSTWTNNHSFVFTNNDGFGTPNPVQFFKYEWNTSTSTNPSWSSDTWISGSLDKTAVASSNTRYLHLRSYNYENNPTSEVAHIGPFWYDGDAPTNNGLYWPADEAVGVSTTPDLQWNDATDAHSGVQSYFLELDDDDDLDGQDSGYRDSNWQADTHYQFASLLSRRQHHHYWQVKSAITPAMESPGRMSRGCTTPAGVRRRPGLPLVPIRGGISGAATVRADQWSLSRAGSERPSNGYTFTTRTSSAASGVSWWGGRNG